MSDKILYCGDTEDCEYKAGRYDEVCGETEGDGECECPEKCEYQLTSRP